MKLLAAIIFTLASAGALLADTEEANLPVASSVTNTDKVRIVKGGASMSAPASLIRQIMAAQITDATVVGRNWITTTSPGAVTFPMVNSDNTVSYLNAGAFLSAIGAGSAVVTIREIDTEPSITFNILEVTDGTLTDMGGGIARLTIAGSGGGGTWGSIIGTLSAQTDLQAALDAKLGLTGNGSGLTGLVFTQLGGSATDAQIPDNITVSLATVATTANAGDSATDFFASGQIERARGGTGADTSAYGAGLFGSDGSNATIDVDTISEFSAALGLTGTPSSSTFMRGDGTWASPASGGGGDMLAANNLSDLINFTTARANLGVAYGVNVLAPNGDGSALTGFTDAQIPAAIARDAEVAAAYQPLDADLTSIAALTTTAFGRGLLDDADATAARVTLGLVIGTNVLAPNGNGSALTGLTFTQLGGAATDAQVPNTITVDLATLATTATTATTANAGDSATAFFTSGQIERARGGTAADTSGYGNALLGSDVSNATVDVDTIGEFSTAIGVTGSPSAANFLRGDGTWSAPAGAGTVTATGGNLTNNAIMLGAGTTDSKVLASLGTTTTVLHGNAAGAPSFGAVSLTADVSGVLPDANIDTAITRDSEAAAAYQPLDSDLTSIAALTTAAFGRGLLDDANAAAGRTSFELTTPTGWLTTDKLVTVGAPIANLSDVLIDAGAALAVRMQPTSSATNVNFNIFPKGTGVIQFAEPGLNYAFLVGSTGMQFTHAGTSYLFTTAGMSLLDDADVAAQRVTLGLNNIANFTASLGISGTASSSTFLRGDGSWTAVTASAPGSDTHVVFNDGGVLGADADLTWNKTTNVLSFPTMQTTTLTTQNFKVLDNFNQSHGLTWVVNGDWTTNKTLTYTGEFNLALTLISDSTFALDGSTIVFADNVRQTFNPGATTPGLNVGSYAGDPSTPSNGDIWYDSTGNTLDARINGATVNLGAGGGGSSIILDITDDGSNESTGVTEIATINDTPGFLTEPSANKALLDLSKLVWITGTQSITGIKTLTTPVISGALTFDNGYLYVSSAMGALIVDTAELNNTKSISADSTLTFSSAPVTGALFGLQITNTDSAAHTITMPSSKSEALGGAARTTFTLWAGQTATLKWRYEGSSVYTVWGDPVRILDLTSASIATTDSISFYDTTDGITKRDTIANLATLNSTTTESLQNKNLTNANNTLPCEFQIACSDMTTAITAATNKAYFRAPYAFTLTAVRVSAFTAPTGATILVDINESGTTVLSTKLMIDATEKTSTTAATAAVISDAAIADDAEITIDFDQVGSTVAGAGIVVTLIGTY